MTGLKNLRGFEISMLQPTNKRGARVKINDLRFKKTKIIPYSYEFNTCKDEGKVYLNSLNILCLYACETEKVYNFDIQIK